MPAGRHRSQCLPTFSFRIVGLVLSERVGHKLPAQYQDQTLIKRISYADARSRQRRSRRPGIRRRVVDVKFASWGQIFTFDLRASSSRNQCYKSRARSRSQRGDSKGGDVGTIRGVRLDSKHNASIKTFMMNDKWETCIDTRLGPSMRMEFDWL